MTFFNFYINIMTYLKQIWNSTELRNKILFTLAGIVIYRLASAIPVPGANVFALRSVLDSNSFLGAFSVLTGGSLSNFSIILMGVAPYINAAIIMQLLTVVVPQLESLNQEGDAGRQKITQYTRWLTLPLGFLQSYGMLLLLNQLSQGVPVIPDTSFLALLPMMLVVTGGTMFVMWLGEIMTEYGIGNGISILIFISITAGVPQMIAQQLGFAQFDYRQILPLAFIILLTIALAAFVVLVTEAQRNIPLSFAGRGSQAGSASIIPIRLNQAGMIPIIFAVSVVTFPQVLASFFVNATTPWIRTTALFVQENFAQTSWWYAIVLFVFVFLFTYFYISITFKPDEMAENIQKRGAFIPGVRPGKNTVEFLAKTSSHLNLWGGLFLGFVTVLPFFITGAFTSLSLPAVPLLIGGAGMIIVVGVVIQIVQEINTSLVMRDYDKIG